MASGDSNMIWAAVLLGATVFLSLCAARRPRNDVQPRRWLVLPDEPRPQAAALPALPAIAVIHPAWRASGESWRADKPLKPWFRAAAPYATALAVGALSLDLTALGLGVPEIFPTHQPVHHHAVDHDPRGGAWPGSDGIVIPEALFDSPRHAGFGMDLAAWDQSDFIVPSWDHAPSHDWWA